ncbi:hypothetical protein TNCV_791271 [Trichonephila clavipes]|nr:hypothetical protein TNCV_791271 [Trichonephila clavipes]
MLRDFFLEHTSWPWWPFGYGHEPVADVLRIRVLVPLKTHRVEELIHIKYAKAQSPPVGVVFGEVYASSGVVLVT